MTILPAKNLLASESSPYLRQHAHNPVHWRPWSAEALAEAKATQRPILLSVGYAACHWCHVMAHESFEDEQVAAVMNRLFVNIKVDREERPDVDQIYMAALTAMGEQGGWPLTMFLTPDAKPFWGGTYFPKEPRYGRPDFIQIMEAIGQTWLEKRADLEAGSEALSDHISQRLAGTNIHSNLDARLLPAFADAIYSSLDMERGGLRGGPKFPNAPFMEALWMNGVRNGHDDHAAAVAFSLQCMLSGGIYDHVGGGLCRYSTDAEWMVPHFEKMLYDNAQLIALGSAVYARTGGPAFKRAIEETIAWLQREMMAEGGGFASSLDADSEGEEGRFYLWTREEIETALDDDADRFLVHYALARPDGWEGEPILYLRDEPRELARDELAGLKSRLLQARARRVRPGRDDKVLTDWNGLMISALANASRVFDRSDWL
ncbi:thioredoxin domain-containing protein, partial [Aminobacter sp. J15]|uniref:thioredoxin domain-containing protein n=3 Tax=Aminobacter TaxID=31988 RepID=UPI0011AA5F49